VSAVTRQARRATSNAVVRQLPVGSVRVGHADRQTVSDALSWHYAEGRLTLEEFDERVAAAWAARTGSELAAVQVDLPPVPAPEADRSSLLASVVTLLRHRTLPAVVAAVVLSSLLLLFVLRMLLWAAGGFGGDGHHEVG